MDEVHVPEDLWSTAMLPKGTLERRLAVDGDIVVEGDAVAAVRIGEDLHDIVAPRAGRLNFTAAEGDLVEPGTTIAKIQA